MNLIYGFSSTEQISGGAYGIDMLHHYHSSIPATSETIGQTLIKCRMNSSRVWGSKVDTNCPYLSTKIAVGADNSM